MEQHPIGQRRHFPIAEDRYRNPLFPHGQRPRRRLPNIISSVFFILLIGLGIGYAVFGSLFRLEVVIVEGNRYVQAAAIEERVEQYLRQRALLVFPRRSYFVFSSGSLEAVLAEALRANPAVVAVEVTKAIPATVTVQLTEHVPNLVYSNGGTTYLLDRDGVLTEEVAPETKRLDPNFPVVFDQNTRRLAVGDHALPSQLVEATFAAQQELAKVGIMLDYQYVPQFTCSAYTELQPPQERIVEIDEDVNLAPRELANANGATNAAKDGNANTPSTNTTGTKNKNANTNRSSNQNSSAARNANTNGSSKNINSAQQGSGNPLIPTDEQPSVPTFSDGTPCTTEKLVERSRELRVKTKDRWEVFFRTDQSITDQMARLLRVIREKQLDVKKLQYVDLRFGDRVVYR